MTDTPKCPECDSPMIEKLNRTRGVTFYSCSRYPKCRATRPIGEDIEGQLEMQDAIGYWGGLSVPTPTKKELAEAKGKQYQEDEIATLCDLLIEHEGDIDAVVADIVQKCNANADYPVRLLDRPRLYTFVNNHIDDVYRALRTARALPALIKLVKSAEQENVKLGAARELLNRADGMPTQKIETHNVHYTWEDVEKERQRTLKQYEEAGVWHHSDKPKDDDQPS